MKETTKAKTSKICEVIPQLEGTIFERKLDDALSDVAKRCLMFGKQGKLTITLTIKPMNEQTQQVLIEHGMKSESPKQKGNKGCFVDSDIKETPMYVGVNGYLSTSPEKQKDLFNETNEVKQNG